MTDSFDEMAAAIVARATDSHHPDHIHGCWSTDVDVVCESTCECQCGAQLAMGPTYERDGRWVWKLPDGSIAPFPDPRLKLSP